MHACMIVDCCLLHTVLVLYRKQGKIEIYFLNNSKNVCMSSEDRRGMSINQSNITYIKTRQTIHIGIKCLIKVLNECFGYFFCAHFEWLVGWSVVGG